MLTQLLQSLFKNETECNSSTNSDGGEWRPADLPDHSLATPPIRQRELAQGLSTSPTWALDRPDCPNASNASAPAHLQTLPTTTPALRPAELTVASLKQRPKVWTAGCTVAFMEGDLWVVHPVHGLTGRLVNCGTSALYSVSLQAALGLCVAAHPCLSRPGQVNLDLLQTLLPKILAEEGEPRRTWMALVTVHHRPRRSDWSTGATSSATALP